MNKLSAKITKTAAAIAVATVLATPTAVFADQYGGPTPVTQISLNKMVRDMGSGNFVDNLGVNNTRFIAGTEVTYRLDVTNNGNTSFGFVDVTDTLPAFLDFVSGPGTYNASNRQLTYRIDNLTPGKTDSREVKVRVQAKEQLPSDGAVFCIVNAAKAQTNDGRTASDTAQICVEQVLGAKAPTIVKQLPVTGSAGVIAGGLLLLSAVNFGYVLRKVK